MNKLIYSAFFHKADEDVKELKNLFDQIKGE